MRNVGLLLLAQRDDHLVDVGDDRVEVPRRLDLVPQPVFTSLPEPSPVGFRPPKFGRSAPDSPHFLLSDFSLAAGRDRFLVAKGDRDPVN